ncbi:NUDIX hydrolase [Loigolactobacillus jiayinensis]|uniref:NUDIX domain-containing protein n=1 Tax=Loigolactobacillus jiayinensis TaxID=2486016 RepID=A0ABW1RG00_9LACO|nr:NUDIX domain-containing protein [Loigolactobacillus jiayinensis]
MAYKYTLALLHYQDQLLVLNRRKPPYPGQWNGIGGKLETGETPENAARREIFEETGIAAADYLLTTAGVIDWFIAGQYIDSIYLYTAELHEIDVTAYPQQMREGLLNFFPVAWLTQPANLGVVPDFKRLLEPALAGKQQRYITNFVDEQLIDFWIKPLA